MAKYKMIIILIFNMVITNSCYRVENEITRIWKINDLNSHDTIVIDKTEDVFFDFSIKKTYFNNNIFNKLYNSKEYSIIKIGNVNYYVFKKEEFFNHHKYRSLKVGIIFDTLNIHQPRTYYIMEHFGLIAIFDNNNKICLDLEKFIYKNDTTDITKFYPSGVNM